MKKRFAICLAIFLTLCMLPTLANALPISLRQAEKKLYEKFEDICFEDGIILGDSERTIYDMTQSNPPVPNIYVTTSFFEKCSSSYNYHTELKKIDARHLNMDLNQPYIKTNRKIFVVNYLKNYLELDDKQAMVITDYLFENMILNKVSENMESSISKYNHTISLVESEMDFIERHQLSLSIRPD